VPAALVTGAGSGIGLGVCRALAADGWDVALNDLDGDLATAAAASLEGSGRMLGLGGDIAMEVVAQALADRTVEAFGRLDVLVANAGMTHFGAFLDTPRETLERLLAVNVAGTWSTVQAAVRAMGDGGAIVLLGSVAGLRGLPGMAAYGATKAALVGLARTLAVELGPLGITVNAVVPGATLTERTREELPDYAGAWADVIPTGRVVTVDDVAATVRFLVGDGGRQVSGQTIVVDGGWSGQAPMPAAYRDEGPT